MKKIGLILQGPTAQSFLDKLLLQYHSSNDYTIITQEECLIPKTYPDNFKFHWADPTSSYKLQKFLTGEFDRFFLIYSHQRERKEIYTLLRSMFAKTLIILDEKESLGVDDAFLEEVSIPSVMSNKLLTFLPNTPTIIQDFGLGKGEVIEIPVPSGSVYCHRPLSSISQKDWKIVGIYRKDQLLLSSYSLSIQPNDKLLAIGDPVILGNIYRQITSSLGQFPIPFGKDLFLYVDEALMSENEILKDLDNALYLHNKLNANQLHITLLHPRSFELITHLKTIQDRHIHCNIDYFNHSLEELIALDQGKKIGLAIVHHRLFEENKTALFKLFSPICKTTETLLADCTSILTLLGDHGVENIAPVALDIASQLELEFKIYDYDVDGNYHWESLEDFQTLSQVFNKPLSLTQTNTKNPIFYLQETQEHLLQLLPFSESIIRSSLPKLTSTNLARLSAALEKHPQILIPTSYENA